MEVLAQPMAHPTAAVRQPKKIEIYEEEKNLDSLIEEFFGIWEIAEDNKVRYRKLWKQFLPRYTTKEGAANPLIKGGAWRTILL